MPGTVTSVETLLDFAMLLRKYRRGRIEGVVRRGLLNGIMTAISEELLAILECPVAHVPLVQSGDWLYSTDPESRCKYPIQDGIPIMLVEEAETADPEEFERVMAEANRPIPPLKRMAETSEHE